LSISTCREVNKLAVGWNWTGLRPSHCTKCIKVHLSAHHGQYNRRLTGFIVGIYVLTKRLY